MCFGVSVWVAAALLVLGGSTITVQAGNLLSPSGYHLCTYNETRNVSFLVVHKVPHTVTRPCGVWPLWKTCTVTLSEMVTQTEFKTVTQQVTRCCHGYVPTGRYCALPVNRSGEFTAKPGSCPTADGWSPRSEDCGLDIDCPGGKKCCQIHNRSLCMDPASSSNYPDNGGNRLNVTVTVKTDYQQLTSEDNGLFNHLRLLQAMVSGALQAEVSVYYLQRWPVHPYRMATSLLMEHSLPLPLHSLTSSLHLLLKHISEVSSITVQDVDECVHPVLRRCSLLALCNNTVGSYQCVCRPGYVDVDPRNPGANCTADVSLWSSNVSLSTNTTSTSTPSSSIPVLLNSSDSTTLNNTTNLPYSPSHAQMWTSNGTTSAMEPTQPTNTCLPSTISSIWAANITGTSFSLCWSSQIQENQTYQVSVSNESQVILSKETNGTMISVGVLTPGQVYHVRVTPHACGNQGEVHHLVVRTDAQTLDATARLTNIQFTADLNDTNSQAYKNLTKNIKEEIYQSLPPEVKTLVDSGQVRIQIRGFSPGSVVVDFTIISIPAPSQNISNVSTALLHSLFNSSKYTVDRNSTGITDFDECASGEHDCSQWADCTNIWASYTCSCLEGFTDNSPQRPGRTCQETVTMETSTFATTAVPSLGSTTPRIAKSQIISTAASTTAPATTATTTTTTPITTTNTPTTTIALTTTTTTPTATLTTRATAPTTLIASTITTAAPTTAIASTITTTAPSTTLTTPTTAPTTTSTTTTTAPTTTIVSTTTTSAPTTTIASITTTPATTIGSTATPAAIISTSTARAPTSTIASIKTTIASTATTTAPTTTLTTPTTTIGSTTTTSAPTTTIASITTAPTTTIAQTTTATAPTTITASTTTTTAPTTFAVSTTTTTAPTTVTVPTTPTAPAAAIASSTTTTAPTAAIASSTTTTAPTALITSDMTNPTHTTNAPTVNTAPTTGTTAPTTLTTLATTLIASTTSTNTGPNTPTSTIADSTLAKNTVPMLSTTSPPTATTPTTTSTVMVTTNAPLTTTSHMTSMTPTATIASTTPTATPSNTTAVRSLQGDLSVECRLAAITVSIVKDFLQRSNIQETSLYLGMLGCGVNGDNETHVQLTVGWNECDTALVHNETYYTASVSLFNTMNPHTSPSGEVLVPRIRLEVPIMCTYRKSMLISADFGPMGYDMIQEGISGLGSFQVKVQLMNGTVPLPQNYSLSPEEAVVVEVRLNTSSDQVKLVISKCWATPTPNPIDVNTYTFLENGCSLNAFTTVLVNGNSSTSRVSVQIFSFVDLDVIYLHCQVQICLQTGADSCALDCLQRTARSGKTIGRSFGSLGPIYKTDDEDSLVEELSLLQIVGFSCLGVGLSLVFIVGFVCLFFFQRNRIGHYNFNNKPKEENFTYLVFNT